MRLFGGHGTDPSHPAPRRPLLLDGAMGTELRRRALASRGLVPGDRYPGDIPAGGFGTSLPLWSAGPLITHPDMVLQIHRDYIAAGADIITTNTFRTTRRTFLKAGLPDRSEGLTRLAVWLAQQARQEAPAGHRVWIAGSMAPLEDCYRPDLVPSEKQLAEEHTLHALRLADAGVDLLLCETMGTIREARAACRAALATGRETVVSFLCDLQGRLYGGEELADAVFAVAPLGPSALAINCVSPRFMEQPLRTLKAATDLPFGIYGNVGIPGGERGDDSLTSRHEQYRQTTRAGMGPGEEEDPAGGNSLLHRRAEEGARNPAGEAPGGSGARRSRTPGRSAGPDAGREEEDLICDLDAGAYAEYALHWAGMGAAFIGGCCGTTPDYIRALRSALSPS